VLAYHSFHDVGHPDSNVPTLPQPKTFAGPHGFVLAGSPLRRSHARKEPGLHLDGYPHAGPGRDANTDIFSVLDSVLLRSLPVRHLEQLVVLTDPENHGDNFGSQTGRFIKSQALR
jgi:hypothetical protein